MAKLLPTFAQYVRRLITDQFLSDTFGLLTDRSLGNICGGNY